jgi:hypothetical protein
MGANATPISMRPPADADLSMVLEVMVFIREQNRALQEQNRELQHLLRRLVDREAGKAAPPKFRRTREGITEIWGGEGTGWIAYDGRVPEALIRTTDVP